MFCVDVPWCRNPEPGIWNLKLESRNQKPKIRNPKLEARNSKPDTRNPKPETQKPKPRSPEPGIRNPKPETRNPTPETQNPKPEPGACELRDPDAPVERGCRGLHLVLSFFFLIALKPTWGYSKLKTRILLGSYCRPMPRRIGPP